MLNLNLETPPFSLQMGDYFFMFRSATKKLGFLSPLGGARYLVWQVRTSGSGSG
jgi:hypothetical protein